MIQILKEDVYLHEWDWKDSPRWNEINNLINNNLGRVVKFFEVQSVSDENAVIISFRVDFNQRLADILYETKDKNQ
jgi:hypothetical protein